MAGNLFEQAMERLRDEMAQKHDHAGICALGEHMTDLLQARPSLAETILGKGKSLSGAFSALEAHARKQALAGGCVVLSDTEGFNICEAYFGINRARTAGAESALEPCRTDIDQEADVLDLDNLLRIGEAI